MFLSFYVLAEQEPGEASQGIMVFHDISWVITSLLSWY